MKMPKFSKRFWIVGFLVVDLVALAGFTWFLIYHLNQNYALPSAIDAALLVLIVVRWIPQDIRRFKNLGRKTEQGIVITYTAPDTPENRAAADELMSRVVIEAEEKGYRVVRNEGSVRS